MSPNICKMSHSWMFPKAVPVPDLIFVQPLHKRFNHQESQYGSAAFSRKHFVLQVWVTLPWERRERRPLLLNDRSFYHQYDFSSSSFIPPSLNTPSSFLVVGPCGIKPPALRFILQNYLILISTPIQVIRGWFHYSRKIHKLKHSLA